jgi:hypothetical protein
MRRGKNPRAGAVVFGCDLKFKHTAIITAGTCLSSDMK